MIRKAGRYIQKSDLAAVAETHTTIDPSMQLRWIEQHESHLIVDSPYVAGDWSRADLLKRLYAEDGRVCGVFAEGELVSWRMFKPDFQKLLNWLEVRSGQGVVFGLAAFTAPHARGKRLMAIITAHAARDYQKRGFHTLMAATDHNNKSALAAHTHIGMQKIAHITDTRWPLGFRTVRINGELKMGFFDHGRRLVYHAS